jgi:hypothetical protein
MSGIEILGTVLTIALIVLLAWNHFSGKRQAERWDDRKPPGNAPG